MGDRNRATILAEFIMRNWTPCRVADVAGGQGNLSMWLALHGYECTVIDPRKTKLSRAERTQTRRSGLRIGRLRQMYVSSMASDYDLVIGLHPDGATRELALSAPTVPVVIVPCCNMWAPGQPVDGLIADTWNRLGIDWWTTRLPMRGRNTAYIARST